MSNPADLVAEGARLKDSIKAQSTRLKEIEAELISLGQGVTEDGHGHKANVIQPSAGVSFPADEESAAKVRELAGEFFGKLFERVITQKPVKAFREIAAAVLPKKAAEKIVTLCESEKSAYVKWG